MVHYVRVIMAFKLYICLCTIEPFCLFSQVGSEIGVSNSDKLFSPFSLGLSPQLGNAVFSDHIVNQMAGYCDEGALFQHGHYA